MTRKYYAKAIANDLKNQVFILGGMVALMWILEFIDVFFLRHQLDIYGILPRNVVGLRGILFAPFLHGGFPHLIANTVPFITLGWLIMLRETREFFPVTVVIMIVGGLGVWLFGAPAYHIGASGLVFGYLGFLLLRGYFERSIVSIGIALVVFVVYGGVLWGVLPSYPGISWESHLFGFIGGVIAAKSLSQVKNQIPY
ncbi:rhomboid family intramembrane serine protease [Merismopedia glauca]|uniref:Rhomboid family intramembrane serine protease n=1 Tax=Merismopedia glauca CCAP 1448/3 TaxID=1296344 RepID=A0A2T1C0V9_9CYAN|nr:rhomboid family intramembrane serine protease [Merismopedia glauca]PSB01901.1 rhomboid family intramembrane serine protease [Merismopedia glauca CCAP 1448/3]